MNFKRTEVRETKKGFACCQQYVYKAIDREIIFSGELHHGRQRMTNTKPEQAKGLVSGGNVAMLNLPFH